MGKDQLVEAPSRGQNSSANTLVRIVDFDLNTHRVKVVRLNDNEPLEPDQSTMEKITQTKRYEHKGDKVLKTSLASDGPIISVDDSSVSLRGNSNFGFFSFKEGGANIIKGPISLATEPHQIRVSGLTTLNPLVTSGFPSTIVTPIPTTVWALPTAAMIKPLLKDVLVMGMIVAACGAGA